MHESSQKRDTTIYFVILNNSGKTFETPLFWKVNPLHLLSGVTMRAICSCPLRELGQTQLNLKLNGILAYFPPL